MLGAVIRNGNNTLVVELPTGTMDLQLKLSSIGIDVPADRIQISDEDGDQIRVKLYASSPEASCGESEAVWHGNRPRIPGSVHGGWTEVDSEAGEKPGVAAAPLAISQPPATPTA